MTTPPPVRDVEEHRSLRRDATFWGPYVAEILARHDLSRAEAPAVGFNATHPTFECGELIVKLFGFLPHWRISHAAEGGALRALAADPAILAPRVVASGHLVEDAEMSWPYLVTTRVPGVPWRVAGLSPTQKQTVIGDLADQLTRVHAIDPASVPEVRMWPDGDLVFGATESSLPPHLVAQVEEYVARLGPFDEVFLHGDLVENHLFVDNGRLTAVIDWGDALITDRHFELMQLHRDVFACDRRLLRAFLDAYGWEIDEDFAHRSLAHGLRRQAMGMVQHFGMDAFQPVAEQFALDDMRTLDELASALFGMSSDVS